MILFVSGATGGHIYPAIAIAEAMKQPCFFVVPRHHPAQTIMAPYAFDYDVFKITIKDVLLIPIMWFKIFRLIYKKKPKVLITMGGGICIPFAIVAWCLRIPVVSFEQNAIPGRATKGTQWFVKQIVTAFESAKEGVFLKSKVRCLGNPVRVNYPDSDQLPKEWDTLNGKTLLVIGGSQGALKINQFITQHKLDLMTLGFNVIHLTGAQFFDSGESYLIEKGNHATYIALRYLNNMNLAYEKASVVICRAGATTLAELDQWQHPSILIPYPYAKDNHQFENAKAFTSQHKSSVILNESEMEISTIQPFLTKLTYEKKYINQAKEQEKMNSICELMQSYLE